MAGSEALSPATSVVPSASSTSSPAGSIPSPHWDVGYSAPQGKRSVGRTPRISGPSVAGTGGPTSCLRTHSISFFRGSMNMIFTLLSRPEIPPPWILRARSDFSHQTTLNQLEQAAASGASGQTNHGSNLLGRKPVACGQGFPLPADHRKWKPGWARRVGHNRYAR